MPVRPEAVGGDQVNDAMTSKRHGDWVGPLGEGLSHLDSFGDGKAKRIHE